MFSPVVPVLVLVYAIRWSPLLIVYASWVSLLIIVILAILKVCLIFLIIFLLFLYIFNLIWQKLHDCSALLLLIVLLLCLVLFRPVGRASYSHSRGGSICACRYGGFRVVGRLLGLLGNLSPLNSSRGTTTLVVVPTTVPDVGLIPILWGCSAALFPTSQMSLPCVVVFSLVVLLALTLQCTRHGSRFGPVLYSVSRFNQLNS